MSAVTPPCVVTIDVGSGSCRALVFDAAGTLLGLAQREWTYHPVPNAAGGRSAPAPGRHWPPP